MRKVRSKHSILMSSMKFKTELQHLSCHILNKISQFNKGEMERNVPLSNFLQMLPSMLYT